MSVALRLVAALLLLVPNPGDAAEGTFELNQVMLPTGNPKFILSSPGTYVLTSNLTISNPSHTAILITAPNVTLDLNGFGIFGPAQCSGVGGSISCVNTGPGNAVHVAAAGVNATIRNGTIRGSGSTGISCFAVGLRVEKLRVIGNGGHGIDSVGLGDRGAVVTGTIVARNLTDGVRLDTGGHAIENVVTDNGADGILLQQGIALRNYVTGNGGQGFFGNGAVRQNLFVGNAGNSLLFNAKSGYGGNVIELNGFPICCFQAPNQPEQIDVNVCDGDTLCP